MKEYPAPEILYLQDWNATVVQVAMYINGCHVTATGSSKRTPGDEFDPGVGYYLALGRALAALGAAVQRLHGSKPLSIDDLVIK